MEWGERKGSVGRYTLNRDLCSRTDGTDLCSKNKICPTYPRDSWKWPIESMQPLGDMSLMKIISMNFTASLNQEGKMLRRNWSKISTSFLPSVDRTHAQKERKIPPTFRQLFLFPKQKTCASFPNYFYSISFFKVS